jgi:CRP-like cAMP-binding protein
MHAALYATVEKASDYLCRRMESLQPICEDITRDLKRLARDRIELPPARLFVREGERRAAVYIVESGWVFRIRTLPSGGRQIVDYGLPGDILGADSLLLGTAGFDLIARSPLHVIRLDAPRVADLWRAQSGFGAAVAWTAAHEAAIMAERVVSLGRRDSMARLAYGLCEMAYRLELVGLLQNDVILTPVNQEDFADLLGISVIHVNRTFRRLAEEGIVDYRKSGIRLLDRKRLAEIADFSLEAPRDEVAT